MSDEIEQCNCGQQDWEIISQQLQCNCCKSRKIIYAKKYSRTEKNPLARFLNLSKPDNPKELEDKEKEVENKKGMTRLYKKGPPNCS